MTISWRIVKRSRAGQAFDGEGARLWGGRWNSPGVALVYTSSSAALATLELLVHLGSPRVLPAYVLFECRFEEAIVASVESADLPAGWRSYPAPADLQARGDRWVASGGSAVLAVPSVIVPQERNYLLNPAHPDFRTIRISEAEPLDMDVRLLP